jgi:hypothetical protein
MQLCIRGCDIIVIGVQAYNVEDVADDVRVSLALIIDQRPHAEWKYDKRESLGLSKTEQGNQIQHFDNCYAVHKR